MTQTYRPTLRDVAKRAGVSPTTASYVLNGRTLEMRISVDAERRVHSAAADLAYRPNPSARSLRMRSTRVVGLVCDFTLGGHVSGRLLTGATEAARERGHLIVMGETEGNLDVEDLLIDDMLGRRVEGILYATMSSRAVVAPSALSGQHAVLLNCVDLEAGLPSVLPDDAMGGSIAARALVKSGVRDGIFVVGESPSSPVEAGPARLLGIQAAMSALRLELAGQVECKWTVVDAFEATSAWLSTGTRAQGLICLNDRIAMGVYQALAHHQLRVPDDVAVVSFDGSDLASWLRPRVASVALPFAEMGRLAMHIVLDRDYSGPRQVRLPMQLVPGDSLPR